MFRDITCPQCGLCIKECILQNDAIKATSTGVEIDLSLCISCGHCTAVCPTDCMDNPLAPREDLIESILSPEAAERFLRTPRSVRYYEDRPVDKATLLQLLNIGRYPQTGENSQGIGYIVVSGRDKLKKINDLYCEIFRELPKDDPAYPYVEHTVWLQEHYGHDALFYNAQHLILAISDKEFSRGSKNAQFSLTFISLLAPSLGLGTCWIGLLEFLICHEAYRDRFASLIDIPADKKICGCMITGYPAVHFRRLVERAPLQVEWR